MLSSPFSSPLLAQTAHERVSTSRKWIQLRGRISAARGLRGKGSQTGRLHAPPRLWLGLGTLAVALLALPAFSQAASPAAPSAKTAQSNTEQQASVSTKPAPETLSTRMSPPAKAPQLPVNPPGTAATAASQKNLPQVAADTKDDGQFTIHKNVDEVNLIFTVTDRHGHFIQNLKQKDFALLDNQRAPAQVYSFTQQTDLPLRVGILIDASTSIRQRFQFEQQAAISFLQQVVRPKTDLAFIMGFDVTSYVTQPYTNNQDKLEAGINKLRPGGGTALYDSVYTACRDEMLNPPNSPQGLVRKALIVISDGDDNQSRAYPDDAIKMCERAGAIIYTISTNVSPSRDRGDDVLKKMADATGGTPFFPHRLEDMTSSFHNIEEELRSQYSLVYQPADFQANGAFRSIYLVTLDKRYTVRASHGYFATKY